MPRFEIDQHVWIKNGVFDPLNGVIVEISSFIGNVKKITVAYQHHDEFKTESFCSNCDRLFESKEDLLKSLKSDLDWLQDTINKMENE